MLQDPIWHDSGHTVKGRDGCRVPIPWEPMGPSLGFGASGAWLPQPAHFAQLAAASQDDDPDSTLWLYRHALAIRRQRRASSSVEAGPSDEQVAWIDIGADVVAFERADGLRCIVNMGDVAVDLPDGDVLLASGPLAGDQLPPDTAAWLT